MRVCDHPDFAPIDRGIVPICAVLDVHRGGRPHPGQHDGRDRAACHAGRQHGAYHHEQGNHDQGQADPQAHSPPLRSQRRQPAG